MNKSISFLIACLFLASCSQSKPSNKSEKKIQEVKTNEISDRMKEEILVEFQSSDLKEKRDEKFKDIKQAKAVEGSGALDALTKNSSSYLAHFKFNMWTGADTKEDRANREELFSDAAREFMNRLVSHTRRFKLRKLSPLFDIRNQRDEFSFFALSIAMKGNLQELIEKTLKAEQDREIIEAHQEILILNENRNISVALLQARMNILSALALKELTESGKANFSQKVESFFRKASFGHLKHLDIPTLLLNQEAQVVALLTEANRLKAFLKGLEENADLEKNLKASFRHVDLEVSPETEAVHTLIKKLLR